MRRTLDWNPCASLATYLAGATVYSLDPMMTWQPADYTVTFSIACVAMLCGLLAFVDAGSEVGATA